jgi:hypothetical protein
MSQHLYDIYPGATCFLDKMCPPSDYCHSYFGDFNDLIKIYKQHAEMGGRSISSALSTAAGAAAGHFGASSIVTGLVKSVAAIIPVKKIVNALPDWSRSEFTCKKKESRALVGQPCTMDKDCITNECDNGAAGIRNRCRCVSGGLTDGCPTDSKSGRKMHCSELHYLCVI